MSPSVDIDTYMQQNCYDIREGILLEGPKWRPAFQSALFNVFDLFRWISFGTAQVNGDKHNLAHVLSWSNIQTITCNLVKELYYSFQLSNPDLKYKALAELEYMIKLIFEEDNSARVYTTYDIYPTDYQTNDLDPNGNGFILHSGMLSILFPRLKKNYGSGPKIINDKLLKF